MFRGTRAVWSTCPAGGERAGGAGAEHGAAGGSAGAAGHAAGQPRRAAGADRAAAGQFPPDGPAALRQPAPRALPRPRRRVGRAPARALDAARLPVGRGQLIAGRCPKESKTAERLFAPPFSCEISDGSSCVTHVRSGSKGSDVSVKVHFGPKIVRVGSHFLDVLSAHSTLSPSIPEASLRMCMKNR